MHHGRSFSISALGDTGADGYVFLNRELSVLLGKRFGLKAESIGQECPVRGFDGKPSKAITHVTFLTMCVDGRIQQQVPMLIADLGKYDMILGRKWFAENDVLLDCRRYRMIQPDEKTLFDDVVSEIVVLTHTAIL
ncbi:Retrovirus polyprotein, putative [Penicillium digitatum Pd1]|uniref:Retrovirus polyprotein, putative n=1 Tax=Penicillium digitatum (strain Pd1 / CECT 20795) TaxID=1170230 RepID=K9G1U8_PEND1|nr:Retrovirus polyprotein, putative [Penicillium digitatum Pd1]EKV14852.1 Retrovirus polyprotein, putative [Penicillium digitatum Pd1]